MARPKYILILIHERGLWHKRYYLDVMAGVWKREGHRVEIQRGPDSRADADVVILHVDLTVVPPDYLEYVRRFPVAVNGRVEDISKRRISTNLVEPGDDYAGPVIVKTDLNAAGQREAWLAYQRLPLFLRRGPLGRPVPRKSKMGYLVLPSVREVPPDVWNDPDLVVERFLPEQRGEHFCTTNWSFFGDRETATRLYLTKPISGGSTVVRREELPGVPEELHRRRVELGFDFGKFDFTIVDGGPVLFDVNRTPAINDLEGNRSKLEALAGGLAAFL